MTWKNTYPSKPQLTTPPAYQIKFYNLPESNKIHNVLTLIDKLLIVFEQVKDGRIKVQSKHKPYHIANKNEIPTRAGELETVCRKQFFPKHGKSLFITLQLQFRQSFRAFLHSAIPILRENNIHIKRTLMPNFRNFTICWLTKSSAEASNKGSILQELTRRINYPYQFHLTSKRITSPISSKTH